MNLHLGDCIEVMATMEPESVDAIVTDPPYGLEFMGKEWDRLGDRGQVKHNGPLRPRATEADDVYGRMRVANYGSANRKCRACGHWEWSGSPCRCEKPDFETREAPQARLMQAWHQQWAQAAYRVAKPSAYLLAFGGTRTVHRMTVALEDAGWIIRDMLVWGYASGFPKGRANLKPAWEPIVMARKPGPLRMLAIDACRIGVDGGGGNGLGSSFGVATVPMVKHGEDQTGTLGRWPANIVLTDPIFDGGIEGVVGGGETGNGSGGAFPHPGLAWDDLPVVGRPPLGYTDTGTYSRFFLIPKAARSDREPVLGGLPVQRGGAYAGGEGMPGRTLIEGQWVQTDIAQRKARANVHPTVKPVDLMRHLVRLVTPTGGIVLDPFLGSGTTGIAAEMEGFAWVGIEREAEYVAIAEARLDGTQRGLGLDAG